MARTAFALSAIVTITLFYAGNARAEDAPVLLTGLPLDAGDASGVSGQLQLADSPASQSSSAPASTDGGLTLGDINVIAKQLDIARQSIEPSLGATVYQFGRQAIETLPQGDNQPLNRLLLQAPGVAQDSFGQIHVRGDHANLQFRLNGIILPEGINVFGQVLQTRLANSVSLITGALPAQYGLRTAGIIDIQTKTGTLDPGGNFTLYGGQQSTFQPSAEYGGTAGRIDYFATGQVLHNAEGIENPAPTFNAIHDISTQPSGFGYVSGIIDPTTRISSIFGVSRSEFQIPNNPGQTPGLGLTADGFSDFDSSLLNENQRQITDFGILALQKARQRARLPGGNRHPLQRPLFFTRPARRFVVQRHLPDRLAPERLKRSAGRRQLSLLGRGHPEQRLLHPAGAHFVLYQITSAAGR